MNKLKQINRIMKQEIEIEHNATYYTVEYSVNEECVGIPSSDHLTIHAIWTNLVYAEDEDIIVLYSDRKEQNHIIDISEKSKVDVDEFLELVVTKINK